MKAKSTYSVKKWEENAYAQISPEKKLTKASVEYEFKGDLEGKATIEYLMCYTFAHEKDQHLSTAIYTGLLRFEGTLGARAGSFVMKDDGKFEGGVAASTLTIIGGSGTGALAGIKGSGMYRASNEGFVFEVEYDVQ